MRVDYVYQRSLFFSEHQFLTVIISDILQADGVFDFLVVALNSFGYRVLEWSGILAGPQSEDLLLHPGCQSDVRKAIGFRRRGCS